jgi:hypothetical protein
MACRTVQGDGAAVNTIPQDVKQFPYCEVREMEESQVRHDLPGTMDQGIRSQTHGIFGLSHTWTYALMDERAGERRMMGTRELLDELVPDTNSPGNDAYHALSLAQKAFLAGNKSWIGYPSGSEVADPRATNLHAVTLDMLAFASILSVIRQPTLAQRYEDTAMDLRARPTEADVEAAREWVGPTLQGGVGSLNDAYIHGRDGKVDEYLEQWFRALMLRLGKFSRGG